MPEANQPSRQEESGLGNNLVPRRGSESRSRPVSLDAEVTSALGHRGTAPSGPSGSGGLISNESVDDRIAHAWEWRTHYKPVFCGICNRTIWAFARQCSKCMLEAHDQCSWQAPQCMGEDSIVDDFQEEEQMEGVGDVELIIKLMSCSNMARKYVMHQPDPFCILTVGRQTFRSHVVKKSFNPVWNSRHVVVAKMTDIISIAVHDNKRAKTSSGGFLGVITVPINDLLEQDLTAGVTVAYRLKKRNISDVVTGLLVFSCKYNNPSRDEALAAQFLQRMHAYRALRLTTPMFVADELDANPVMRDVVSNMESNVFGHRQPDNRPNAQLRSYGVQTKVSSVVINTDKFVAMTDLNKDEERIPQRLPVEPMAPICTPLSDTSVTVQWHQESVANMGKKSETRYTLVRDQGLAEEAQRDDSFEDSEQWSNEYMGPNCEHVAVALTTGLIYRFRLKASNTYGSTMFGPWSEPIKVVSVKEPSPVETAVEPVVEDTREHCVFFMSGYCHYGKKCPFSHGTGIQDENDLAIAMLAAALNQDAVAGTALAVAASLKESTSIPIDTSNMSQFKRDLHAKHVRLREKLRMTKGECHLTVVRPSLFASTYAEVMNRSSKELKKKLFVHFKGEGGLDYGGLAREWFFLLSHELFAPKRGLFEFSDDTSYLLQLNVNKPGLLLNDTRVDEDKPRPTESVIMALKDNPLKGVMAEEEDHPKKDQVVATQVVDMQFYTLVGRILGLAVYHNHFLDVAFVPTFYKLLLGRPIELSDMEEMDPSIHKSLLWMLDNSIDGVLDQSFCLDTQINGEMVSVDLIPNGHDIAVTDANKEEFVQHMVRWRAVRGTEDLIEAIRQGFFEFVPQEYLVDFNEKELELLVSGVTVLDVADWKNNTIYKDYQETDDNIQWFWKVVEEANSDMRLRMLQFVTGTQRIPPEGFQALIGTDGLRKFCIQKVPDTTKLPSSHT
eukprot:Ihof_evm5s127 gene=Ihof_evmTU5s127